MKKKKKSILYELKTTDFVHINWKEISKLFMVKYSKIILTLVLLSPDIPCFANSVDPDSEEAN